MITVKYIETLDALKGFTIYNGDYNIFINEGLNTSERTHTYLTELHNIESGKYEKKIMLYNKEWAM